MTAGSRSPGVTIAVGVEAALAETGPGVAVAAGVACGIGIGEQYIEDQYGEGAGNGIAYLDFLYVLGEIGHAFA